jgi:hypothetical protein
MLTELIFNANLSLGNIVVQLLHNRLKAGTKNANGKCVIWGMPKIKYYIEIQ